MCIKKYTPVCDGVGEWDRLTSSKADLGNENTTAQLCDVGCDVQARARRLDT